jgi:hypothetical protein
VSVVHHHLFWALHTLGKQLLVPRLHGRQPLCSTNDLWLYETLQILFFLFRRQNYTSYIMIDGGALTLQILAHFMFAYVVDWIDKIVLAHAACKITKQPATKTGS